ncbi:MAG TPA: VOC family protein [Myxococcaceae bacterium]|nr:VOC family protein [Myxococcaceae bacterium]
MSRRSMIFSDPGRLYLRNPNLEMHMPANHPRKIFVNLPVRDLKKSVAFFTKLGFGFNAQFTSEDATCMILSEEAYVMLLTNSRFADFAKKPVADAGALTEGIFCLSAASRAEVDELVNTALEVGGTPAAAPMDHGFMYGRSFYDVDGHHWEAMWMDPSAISAQPSL